MSQNNKDNSLAIGAAVVGTAFMMLAFAIVIGLAFLAFVVSIACAYVWCTGRPAQFLWVHITPDEAKTFILRGLAGSVLVPVFTACALVVFGGQIIPEGWLYLILGGYIGGSLGLDWLESQQPAQSVEIVAPPMIDHQPRLPSLPVQKADTDDLEESRPCFRFATWDDDEELRR